MASALSNVNAHSSRIVFLHVSWFGTSWGMELHPRSSRIAIVQQADVLQEWALLEDLQELPPPRLELRIPLPSKFAIVTVRSMIVFEIKVKANHPE